jgi:hypothetical protein
MKGVWPTEQIDHADRNDLNDAWLNLREANQTEQKWNQGCKRTSQTGLKGTYKRGNRYGALVRIDGERVFLGMAATKEDAHELYKRAVRATRGKFHGL